FSRPQRPPSTGRGLLPSPPAGPSFPVARRPRFTVVCQYCDKTGHSAKTCFKLNPRSSQVNFTTATGPPRPSSSSEVPWLVDSAATHHVTPDLGTLSLYSDYTGPDEVLVGDGTGSTHRSTPSSRPE
ncbi:unnamed protein product, partial [Linum tenue]